jgi:ADP-heptose:LPS heptosyltransferase
MKICLIQLTRIGDIIQTYRAANQLKVEKPNIELTLITRRRFSGQLTFLLNTVFDNVIEFETKDFFDKEKADLQTSKLKLNNFINDIKKNKFDLVINLSFNKSSTYLTSLLAGDSTNGSTNNLSDIKKTLKMGLYRNKTAQVGIDDKWSQFIYSNVMETTHCPFNLVDIYRSILGAREIDVTDYQTPTNKVITIHPFASSRKKSWSMTKWTELIYKVLKEDKEVEINIVGAKNDTDLAHRIIDNPILKIFNKRIHDFVGTNTIEDTFNVLSDSHLFIGHDSMVSHLAGLFRMPSIILSLGTVRPHETTPYNDRIVNLVPKNKCFPCAPSQSCEALPCHNSLNHSAVAQIAHNLLNAGSISNENIVKGISSFQLEAMHIFTASFDEAGLKLTEISGSSQDAHHTFKVFYRMIWSYYFNNKEVSSDVPNLSQENIDLLHRHLEGTKHLFELYTHGLQFCNQILDESEKETPSVSEIRDRVSKIAEVDQLTEITKKAYPLLAPLTDFFFVNKANALGTNIIEITNNNLIAFHEASNMTAIMNDLLTKTVGPQINASDLVKEV